MVSASIGVGVIVGAICVGVMIRVRVGGTSTVVPGAIVVSLAVGARVLGGVVLRHVYSFDEQEDGVVSLL